MAELGWLGLTVPEEYGGSDAGAVELCLLLEHSLRGLAPIGGIGPTLITAAAYQKFGTEEQRKRALELVVNGGTLSISMSEPGAGSDVAALRCKAERDGDILLEVSDAVRETLIADMDDQEILAVAGQLDADELADLAPDLPRDVVHELMEALDAQQRERVRSALIACNKLCPLSAG